jgi:hypothetical protein
VAVGSVKLERVGAGLKMKGLTGLGPKLTGLVAGGLTMIELAPPELSTKLAVLCRWRDAFLKQCWHNLVAIPHSRQHQKDWR